MARASLPKASLLPTKEPFLIRGRHFTAGEVIARLSPFLLEERVHQFERIIAARTCTIVPVIEGIYDRGNVSAVVRSAEALGYQAMHVIDTSLKYKAAKRVAQGADKWLDLARWTAPADCIESLRAKGYRIIAAHVREATPVEDMAFDTPTAVFLGNEKDGLSDEVLARADGRLVLPMPGFTGSYNISVAAAVCLYHIFRWRTDRLGGNGDLTPGEQRTLLASFMLRSVREAKRILLAN